MKEKLINRESKSKSSRDNNKQGENRNKEFKKKRKGDRNNKGKLKIEKNNRKRGNLKKRKTTGFTFSDPNDKTKDCHFIDAVLSKFVVFREKKSTSCQVPNDDTFLQSKRFKICFVPGEKLKIYFANDLVLESIPVFSEQSHLQNKP